MGQPVDCRTGIGMALAYGQRGSQVVTCMCMGWGLFFGHKYEARYDSIMPFCDLKGLYSSALEAVKNKVYKGDVCVRCGDVVNKQ